MRILITGAGSFIGKSLIEQLSKEKYQIVAKTRCELDLLNIDKMRDFFEEQKSFDYIIHTAAVGGRKWEGNLVRHFYENVKMFENLLLFKDRYKKIITFGSGAEFGDVSHLAKESDLNEKILLNHYGLAKRYITNKVRIEDLPVKILRIWGCFGKHEDQSGFIKANMIRNKASQPMFIHHNKWMDFIYVNDLVLIIEKILQKELLKSDSIKDVNITYEDKHTLFAIANMINDIGANKVKIKFESGEISNSYMGSSGLNLDNIPGVIGLKAGLKEMYNEL